MRGDATHQAEMLVPVTPDNFVPADHPIRVIKAIVDPILRQLSPVFAEMYADRGRPSIPPEHLLKALLLKALYTVRSERQLCERLRYDLLFKWFLDLNISDPGFDPTTFCKNRDRLLAHEVAPLFFAAVLEEARRRKLLSAEHFTVDGTLLEAWASMKSVRPRDGDGPPPAGRGKNPSLDFHGTRRSNLTHVSATDPDARLARKASGKETKLCYAGHVLMENRTGLITDVLITRASGTAERDAALQMLDRRSGGGRTTLGADKGYDTRDFVTALRDRDVTPHVAKHTRRPRSGIDGRVMRHPGYEESQRKRKRVEEFFGWLKTVGGGRKLGFIGQVKNQLAAYIAGATFNLVRMANTIRASAA
jgi:transposase